MVMIILIFLCILQRVKMDRMVLRLCVDRKMEFSISSRGECLATFLTDIQVRARMYVRMCACLCMFIDNAYLTFLLPLSGHPQSIDAILPVDEDTIITGSSDGLIR